MDELPLGVEVHDGFGLAGPDDCGEDVGVIIGSGEGVDFGDGVLEIEIDLVLQ